MIDPSGIQDQDGDIRALKKSVEHFGEPGFALIPHQKPFWRKVYTHIWVLAAILIFTLAAFTILQVQASNQTLAEINQMPDVEKRAWQLIKFFALKKCQKIDFPKRRCYLKSTTTISDQIELSYNMYKLVESSADNQLINFEDGWEHLVYNYLYYSYYNTLERYKNYDEFLADVNEERQNQNENVSLISFEEYLDSHLEYVDAIESDVEAFNQVLASELHRITSLYWTHGIWIFPDYWYLDHQGQFHTQYSLIFDFSNPIRMVFILVFGMLVVVFPFGLVLIYNNLMMNQLSRLTPKVFYQLIMDGHLLPKVEAVKSSQNSSRSQFRIRPTDWKSYISDMNSAVTDSPWRIVFYIILTSTLLLFTIPISVQGDVYKPFNSQIYKLYMTTLLVVAIPFVCYILSQYIWVLFVTARYLVWLPKFFKIKINPYKEDNSGGLSPIGDLIFMMAVILAPYCLLVLFWVVSDYLAIFKLEALHSLFILFLPIVLFLFVFLMFLSPLAVITIEMRAQKKGFEQEGGDIINRLKETLRDLAVKDALNSPEGATARQQLETMEKIYPPLVRFPVWPFSNRVRVRYLAAQLVQVGSFLYGLFEILNGF